MSDAELTELKNAGVYIAGFTDASIKRRNDLWDVLVDGMRATFISHWSPTLIY